LGVLPLAKRRFRLRAPRCRAGFRPVLRVLRPLPGPPQWGRFDSDPPSFLSKSVPTFWLKRTQTDLCADAVMNSPCRTRPWSSRSCAVRSAWPRSARVQMPRGTPGPSKRCARRLRRRAEPRA